MTYESTHRLGRLPSIRDRRTLQLERYLAPPLPPPPDTCDWSKPIADWPAAGNDRYGDCVFATASHLIHLWSANTGPPRQIPDADVVATYLKYSPRDAGYNILDRLKLWRYGDLWDQRLWAFTAVNPHNHALVRSAISLFGALDVGVNLPSAWQGTDTWDTGPGWRYKPGTWGGHSVPIIAYGAAYLLAVTWGHTVRISWSALEYYADEAYALIDPLWLRIDGHTPDGLDLVSLRHDLAGVTS
jgi:hypothetical protein